MKNIDSWKTSIVPYQMQLEMNLKELSSVYPPHWNTFISILKEKGDSIKRVVDIGCGAGIYSELSKRMNVDYIGYDYSPFAIELCESTWDASFECLGYESMTTNHINDDDLLVANAIFDVLPNGDEALSSILKLKPKRILSQRVRIVDDESHFDTHSAYGIETYMYFHNKKILFDICRDAGYNISLVKLNENVYDMYNEREN